MAKSKRLITFNTKHDEILKKMMEEDGQESYSYFLGGLIAEEWKAREEHKNKRPQGRPKGSTKRDSTDDDQQDNQDDTPDFSDDFPKDKPYYGQLVGPRELYYLENRKIELPPNA